MIGKGPRNAEVVEALKKQKAVYFSTIGGAGVYLASRIKEAKLIAFPDLVSEAVFELLVHEFPCYVAIDPSGKSIYK